MACCRQRETTVVMRCGLERASCSASLRLPRKSRSQILVTCLLGDSIHDYAKKLLNRVEACLPTRQRPASGLLTASLEAVRLGLRQ